MLQCTLSQIQIRSYCCLGCVTYCQGHLVILLETPSLLRRSITTLKRSGLANSILSFVMCPKCILTSVTLPKKTNYLQKRRSITTLKRIWFSKFHSFLCHVSKMHPDFCDPPKEKQIIYCICKVLLNIVCCCNIFFSLLKLV